MTPEQISELELIIRAHGWFMFVCGAFITWFLRFRIERALCWLLGHVQVIGSPGCPRCGFELPEDTQ